MIKIHPNVEKNIYETSLELILENFDLIKKELITIPKNYYSVFYQIQNVTDYDSKWTFYPILYKKRTMDFERLAPLTTNLLNDIGIINAGFSLFGPNSKTTLHSDNAPYTYRSHLGLIVPDKSSFLLEGKNFTAKEKEITLFSTELEHITVNESDEDRYILLLDFLRPNISIDKLFNSRKK
jgi:aspartyl/asparaginyl beta-hydroxylase (cupin superfamily)